VSGTADHASVSAADHGVSGTADRASVSAADHGVSGTADRASVSAADHGLSGGPASRRLGAGLPQRLGADLPQRVRGTSPGQPTTADVVAAEAVRLACVARTPSPPSATVAFAVTRW
jgi:hypothetical protein